MALTLIGQAWMLILLWTPWINLKNTHLHMAKRFPQSLPQKIIYLRNFFSGLPILAPHEVEDKLWVIRR